MVLTLIIQEKENRASFVSKHTEHDPYQSLRFRDYRLLLSGNFIASMGEQMLTLAIGWELYERTNSAFLLGMVGLVQVFPVLILSLYTGYVADRYNRKLIVVMAQAVLVLASLGLTALSYWHGPLLLIYGCLLLMGIAMAFNTPASTTLPAHIVLVIAISHSATFVYVLNAMAALVFVALVFLSKYGHLLFLACEKHVSAQPGAR